MNPKINTDPINHPSHYTSHPSGVECIEITEHFNFNLGNAIKYIWRAGEKGYQLEDLKKAEWYIKREIKRINKIPTEDFRAKIDLELRRQQGFNEMITQAKV